MQIAEFKKSFDKVRSSLAAIDALTTQAGEHFNESQIETAQKLLSELRDACDEAVADADAALVPESESADYKAGEDLFGDGDADEGNGDGEEVQEGDVLIVKNGKLVKLREPSDVVSAIVGQTDNGGEHADPVTRAALASIADGLEKARNKAPKASPGVLTTATGVVTDKPAACDDIELATDAGGLQSASTDDGSRIVQEAAPGEAVKVLTADVDTQKNIKTATDNVAEGRLTEHTDQTQQFTPSPTADAPGDVAAISAGAQEVLPPPSNSGGTTGVVVAETRIEPADDGTLKEFPRKSSGIDGDAGDWTAAGRDKDGFPVAKDSPEDVTSVAALL